MTEKNENSIKKGPSEKRLVTLTITGIIIVLLTFITLYKAERINSRAWQAKNAGEIDPARPGQKEGMVSFTGIPGSGLVVDKVTGKRFVFLREISYVYKKVEKSETKFITKNGTTQTVTRKYFENDWVQEKDESSRAEGLTVGKIRIRLDEAELMGKNEWEKTVYIKKSGKIKSPGDKKFVISGINAEKPLFAVGYLKKNYLGSGKIFLVSAYSEGKTIEQLRDNETGLWSKIRNFFCFIFLFTGLLLLSSPAIYLLNRFQEYPVLKQLSSLGWAGFSLLSLIISYLIIKYSSITADLLWVILAGIIIVPGVLIFRKLRSS